MRLLLVFTLLAGTSLGQTQPRVFITDSVSWETDGWKGGARPQTAEIAKTFLARCPSVRINNRKDVADYVVVLHHEGGKGWGERDNKVVVYDGMGDLIYGGSTAVLGNAVKDSCAAIVSDWSRKADANTVTPELALNAVALTMRRTENHIKRSGGDVAFRLVDEVTSHLKSKSIPVVQDKDEAPYRIELVIDRPMSKWVKVTVTASDSTGKMLWEDIAEDGGSMSGKGGLNSTIAKLRAILDKRLTEHPVIAKQ